MEEIILSKKWHEELTPKLHQEVFRLSGCLGMQDVSEYQTFAHFINDVFCRVVECKSLLRQAVKLIDT